MKTKTRKLSLILLLATLFLIGGSAAWAADAYQIQTNQNSRIDVQITDDNGRSVAPGREIDSIKYIIKSKPEGAKASVYTANGSKVSATGKFTMAVSCDTPGVLEVQSFVTVKDAPKYYTGTHLFNVVDEKSDAEKKIVIMSIGSVQMIVNNDVVKNDAAPVIQQGRTFVPLRALSNIFDAQCSYDGAAKTVTITKDDTVIVMTIGEEQFTVNGQPMTMDAPAYVTENGRAMVPVRFIANAFGAVIKLTNNADGSVADIMLQL